MMEAANRGERVDSPVRVMSLAPGTRLGPYEIVSSIGAGGMGEVYRARDPRLGRDVAVKIISGADPPSAGRLRRFEREAQAVAALKHPHILAVYDVGAHEGQPYVVFELLDGETLRRRLSRGPLPVGKAIELATDICQALAAAHAQGVVHRDLKPENLFVAREGGVKLLDFGLAKLQDPDAGSDEEPTGTGTTAGAWVGTPGYVAPEQLRGAAASPRSDLFALGAVLYEMLTGQRAFGGESRTDRLSAILDRDPPPMATAAGPVPVPLERIVRRCLEKDPEDRFQSARDVAFALEAVWAPSGAMPGPLAAPERVRRRFLPAVAVAVLLAGAAAAAYFVGRRQADRPPPTFHQLTFRRGLNGGARFLPDGQTIAYGASWEGQPFQLFSARADSAESRALDLPAADLLAVSSRGEMAISLGRELGDGGSVRRLARVPFAGGAPREVLDDVESAEWSPDGKELAVVRVVGGKSRLEYPIGRVLHEGRVVASPRISPKGDAVAFADDEGVHLVDRGGTKRTLARPLFCRTLAWSPRGDEVWYTENADRPALLYAVSLAGRRRLLDHYSVHVGLQDVAKDGKALISMGDVRLGMAGVPPGDTRERDLSWLNFGEATYLSPDARTLLFTERGEGRAGQQYAAYLRQTDGASPAVRLGDGMATALSRDGKWALVVKWNQNPEDVVLLPTGSGEPRVLSVGTLRVGWAAFHPDGRRVVISGGEPGGPSRDYVQDIGGGPLRPLTPEGVHSIAFLEDGSPVGRDAENRLFIYPVNGGKPQPVAGPPETGFPCQSAPDGRTFCVVERHGTTYTFFTRDIGSGRRVVRGTVTPADPAGLIRVRPILAEDGKSYVYSYVRLLSNLYVQEGLR